MGHQLTSPVSTGWGDLLMQNFTFQESSPLTAIIRNKAEEPIIRGIESSVLVRVPYGDLIGSR